MNTFRTQFATLSTMELFLRPRDSITLIALALLLVFAHGQIRKSPRSHYEDMNCSPLPNKTSVRAYKCLFENHYTDKCINKGKLYDQGKVLPDVDCSVGCVCMMMPGSPRGYFQCAAVDCWEGFFPPNRSCLLQYSLDGCCSIKHICNEKEIKKLFTCKVDGKVYREGEVFYPENTCKKCVCSKGFRGQYVAPYCKTLDCGIDKSLPFFLENRPAVVYLEKRPCCPIWWKDQEKTDKIVRVGARSPYQCTYRDQKLNINDRVVTTNPCLSCSCDYPPLVTCIQKSGCNP